MDPVPPSPTRRRWARVPAAPAAISLGGGGGEEGAGASSGGFGFARPGKP
jgi:hypothetical protein